MSVTMSVSCVVIMWSLPYTVSRHDRRRANEADIRIAL